MYKCKLVQLKSVSTQQRYLKERRRKLTVELDVGGWKGSMPTADLIIHRVSSTSQGVVDKKTALHFLTRRGTSPPMCAYLPRPLRRTEAVKSLR